MLVAILSFIAVAQYAALAVLSVVNERAVVAYLHVLSPSGSGPERVHLALGSFQPLYYSAMLVLTAILGFGFWKLWNWTRVVILAMTLISLGATLFMLPEAARDGSGGAWALWALRLVLCVLWTWYLMRRPVREAFRSAVVPHAA
jgi:hypothetical protein